MVGQVALAGEVVEGDWGYRAARAWILKLFVPRLDWRQIQALNLSYGVPIGVLMNPISRSQGR